MPHTMRAFQSDEDYFRLRGFLREVFVANGRRQFSWDVQRFDYWRWHGVENIWPCDLREQIFIWEDAQGQPVAFVCPESPGDVFLQVHPAVRSITLEEAMLDLAEERLTCREADGSRRLVVWAQQGDPLRTSLLRQRGFEPQSYPEYQRRQDLSVEPVPAPLPDGFTLRALGGPEELPARSWLSWRAFHPDEPDEKYEGWDWYRNVQRAPLYRRDLDLVAVSPDGELAAFATVWLDDVTHCGVFEPVGTRPEDQRKGLSKALLMEGLRRLRHLGATQAMVGSYSAAASAAYASAGFTAYDLNQPWLKRYVK